MIPAIHQRHPEAFICQPFRASQPCKATAENENVLLFHGSDSEEINDHREAFHPHVGAHAGIEPGKLSSFSIHDGCCHEPVPSMDGAGGHPLNKLRPVIESDDPHEVADVIPDVLSFLGILFIKLFLKFFGGAIKNAVRGAAG